MKSACLLHQRTVNKSQHLLVHVRGRVVLVHRMTRVSGDVHAEVACLRVQLLRIRGDAGVLRARGNGVAVAEAERHVLRTRDDVHRPRKVVRGAHDRRLRKEHALCRRLLRGPRQIEGGGREVREVEEVELVGLRLRPMLLVVVVMGALGETYEASDEIRVRELARREAVREYLCGGRVHTACEELA